jgi:hypothetical protein
MLGAKYLIRIFSGYSELIFSGYPALNGDTLGLDIGLDGANFVKGGSTDDKYLSLNDIDACGFFGYAVFNLI